MRPTFLPILTLLLCAPPLHCKEPWQPFDPAVISRLSVDNVPRSLAICQGKIYWLAYDLERAALIKCWRNSNVGQGLTVKTFTTQSRGKTLWVSSTQEAPAWRLLNDPTAALSIRYLGCKDQRSHIALTWEMKHKERQWELEERVPIAHSELGFPIREWRVTGLQQGEQLVPIELQNAAWSLQAEDAKPVSAIQSDAWHQLILNP